MLTRNQILVIVISQLNSLQGRVQVPTGGKAHEPYGRFG